MNRKPILGFAIDGVMTIAVTKQKVWLKLMGEGYIDALYKNALPKPAVIKFIKLLKEKGYKTFLVSGRLGESAREYTVEWLKKQGLEYLSSGLYVNYEGDDLLNVKLATEHKIKYIRELGIEVYFEHGKEVAEKLRKETNAIIICTTNSDSYEKLEML